MPHSLLPYIIGYQSCTSFFPRRRQTFISISLHLTVKISKPVESLFWNAKVQIHSLQEKTKTEVNQLTQVHEAIWPLAQEDTVETSRDLPPKTESQNFRYGWNSGIKLCISNIKNPRPRNATNVYLPHFPVTFFSLL